MENMAYPNKAINAALRKHGIKPAGGYFHLEMFSKAQGDELNWIGAPAPSYDFPNPFEGATSVTLCWIGIDSDEIDSGESSWCVIGISKYMPNTEYPPDKWYISKCTWGMGGGAVPFYCMYPIEIQLYDIQ